MERSRDDEVLVVSGDIADRKTAERAISEGMARFGRIDTLVNNAGIFIAKPFTQYTEADCTAMLAVNLTGFFHVTQLAVAEMEKQGISCRSRRAWLTMRSPAYPLCSRR
jgi:NADP-dependent 3-hydroxy acid dehydrogenase YdfG